MLESWFKAVPQAARCRLRRLTDQGKKNANILVYFVKRQHGDPTRSQLTEQEEY